VYVASAPRRGSGGRLLLIAAATAVGTGAAVVPGVAGVAYGTDHGGVDLQVHATTTGFTEPRDEAKVCRFYLAASAPAAVPGAPKVAWALEPRPGTDSSARASGEITLTAGAGHTGPLSLPNGDYQVTWSSAGQSGATQDKPYKTFTVSCTGRGAPPGGSGVATRSVPMGRDVFGNLVPAGGADTGSGSTAAASDGTRTATGIAVALGAVFVGGRLLRHGGRGRRHPRSR
jgi:hypothetical protein